MLEKCGTRVDTDTVCDVHRDSSSTLLKCSKFIMQLVVIITIIIMVIVYCTQIIMFHVDIMNKTFGILHVNRMKFYKLILWLCLQIPRTLAIQNICSRIFVQVKDDVVAAYYVYCYCARMHIFYRKTKNLKENVCFVSFFSMIFRPYIIAFTTHQQLIPQKKNINFSIK